MKYIALLTVTLTVIAVNSSAQNFSGLQNKRLTRIEDVSSLVESQIGNLLGGKINGKIDSVVVTVDSEKILKGKIYYTEFINGFFTVSVLTASKQRQNEIVTTKFSQAAKPSPCEFTLQLAESVPKGTRIESPFLRIDVAKKENGTGNINLFSLNKSWKNELDPQNVIINVALNPVGKAASLTNQVKDVVPD